jgi:UV DNA damage endonuclease
MYSTKELFEGIHKNANIPIVFDYHHHRFCTGGQSEEEALRLAVSTWGDIKPIVHYSESKALNESLKVKLQAHSDYYLNKVETYGLDLDIMMECKAKELAVMKYKKDFL